MATRLRDILPRLSRPAASQGQGTALPTETLPLGTCGSCEAVNFAAFREVAMGEERVYKSPDRRAAEVGGTPHPVRFRCRSCGKIVTHEPDRLGEVRSI